MWNFGTVKTSDSANIVNLSLDLNAVFVSAGAVQNDIHKNEYSPVDLEL
jgi:hypothetical protein